MSICEVSMLFSLDIILPDVRWLLIVGRPFEGGPAGNEGPLTGLLFLGLLAGSDVIDNQSLITDDAPRTELEDASKAGRGCSWGNSCGNIMFAFLFGRLNVESVGACADGPVMDITVCKSGSSGPTGVQS